MALATGAAEGAEEAILLQRLRRPHEEVALLERAPAEASEVWTVERATGGDPLRAPPRRRARTLRILELRGRDRLGRRRGEEGAVDAKVLEQEVLDQLYDGLYLVDTERRICFWNRAAEGISGYARDEILGRRCFDDLLRHVDEGGRRLCHDGCPLLATLRDGERREARVYLQHRDGHRMPVEIRVSPVRDRRGEIVGAVEVFNDGGRRLAEKRRFEELERQAFLDPLTQIGNRRRFDSALAARLRELEATGAGFGLLLADLDHFKRFNDTWGHPAGDRLLQRVARTLELAVRGGDDVCRFGGEEFAILAASDCATTLAAVAERLRALVASIELAPPATGETIGISIGAALAHRGDQPANLVERADCALYASKRAGRNRVTEAA